MSDLTYFEATMDDVEAIGRFNGLTDPEMYKHEYWTRQAEHSVLMASREDDDVMGVQALIPYYLKLNGRKVLTGKSERTLVSSNYRGQGVWFKLMEACVAKGKERGHEFFWGASTPAVRAFKKLGFMHLHGHRQRLLSAVNLSQVISLVRSSDSPVSLNPAEAYRTVRERDLEQGLKYVRVLSSLYSSLYNAMPARSLRSAAGDKFEIIDRPRSYEDIDELYQELRGDKSNLLWLHQDEEFCDWAFRLGRNPVKRWYAYENGRLRGYLYGMFGGHLARIVDFAAADAAAFKRLLGSFRKTCLEQGQVFMEVTVNPLCPQQQIAVDCLEGDGFLKTYTGGTTVVRPGGYMNMNLLSDPGCFYLTDLWSLLYKTKNNL